MNSKYIAQWSFKKGQLNFYRTHEFMQMLYSLGQGSELKPAFSLTPKGWINEAGSEQFFSDEMEKIQFHDFMLRDALLFFNNNYYKNQAFTKIGYRNLDFTTTVAFAIKMSGMFISDENIDDLNKVFPEFKSGWNQILDADKTPKLVAFKLIDVEGIPSKT